jgi:hypothetical protein
VTPEYEEMKWRSYSELELAQAMTLIRHKLAFVPMNREGQDQALDDLLGIQFEQCRRSGMLDAA